MTKTKKTDSKQSRKESARFTTADVRRLYDIVRDESQSEEARDWLWGTFSDLASCAPSLDYLNDKRIFTRAIGEVLSNLEANNGPSVRKNEDYQFLKMVLRRTSRGETLNALYEEDKAERAAWREQERNQPEPRNWRSADWRYWKLQQLSEAFQSGDQARYSAAWREYQALLGELVADDNFYQVKYAAALLPYLIIARQEIASLGGQPRSARAKPQAFRTKKGGAR
jgi:hypothetical protein